MRRERKRIIRIMLILILTVVLLGVSLAGVLAKTYFTRIGNWQGWYEAAGGTNMDGDTYRYGVTFGYKHVENSLQKYSYTGIITTPSYVESTANITASPSVPSSGNETTLGTSYIYLARQHAATKVTLTVSIKNNSTGSTTTTKTISVTIPKKDSYTLSYDSNGGYYPPASQVKWHNENLEITRDIPMRPGYVFQGWSTDPDGSSVEYKPGDSFAGNAATTLYAVWAEIAGDEAEISVRKTLLGAVNSDTYSFILEPVRGWYNDSVDTHNNGTEIPASMIPMPAARTVSINNLDTADGNTGNASFGTIRFIRAGWYMYKISEVLPDTRVTGIRYDDTEYYAVVYVVNGPDGDAGGTGNGYSVKVRNITLWHNNGGSKNHIPDLSDISGYADTDDGIKTNDEPMTFGKVEIDSKSVEARFWQRAGASALRVVKNVRGSLGDRSAEFRFVISLSGLGNNVQYHVIDDGAELISGFTDGKSFTSSADGRAELEITLSDDDSLEIEGIPVGSSYSVREIANTHRASYEIWEGATKTLEGGNSGNNSDLVIAQNTIKAGKLTKVIVNNEKNIVPMTGVRRDDARMLFDTAAIALTLLAIFGFLMRGIARGRRDYD